MKALVLCGGLPQIELIKNLKERGIETILADYNGDCIACVYADKFYEISVFDVEEIINISRNENVDFLITVCADQVLQVVAEVSERLNLPCYIDYETSKKVSSKKLMKKIFWENDIPTTKYVVLSSLSKDELLNLNYPLIVKPVDSYSSRGVKRVDTYSELERAFNEALEVSKEKQVVVEEFFSGLELSVDVFVENGCTHILCVSALYKIPGNNKFVINRLVYPAPVNKGVYLEIEQVVDKIAKSFNLKNTPMLVQLITDGENISVVEFCARTGGGDKFRLIKRVTGFDVIDAVVKLTVGEKTFVTIQKKEEIVVDEFLYCKEGVLDYIVGQDELIEEKIIDEFHCLKIKGQKFGKISSSSDRVAYFSISGANMQEVCEKHREINRRLKVMSQNGEDILNHDILTTFYEVCD